MRRPMPLNKARILGFLCCALGVASGACSSSTTSGAHGKSQPHRRSADGGGPDGGVIVGSSDGGGPIFHIEAGHGAPHVTPEKADVTVNPATGVPDPVQFTVTGTGSASIMWVVSNPALGYIDQNGLFTPTGRVGGTGTIEVLVDGKVIASAPITLTIAYEQNGGVTSETDAGAGGLGGVGGEGFGGKVPDATLAVLKRASSTDPALTWLYPYDDTVFPLDVLPPLLQWSEGSNGPVDAVSIHLSAPPYFDYKGYFGRPDKLAAGAPFVRHPIPKDIWRDATLSAAGSTLTVELAFVANGTGYGPLTQDYKIALAPINGIIYYQAYNTGFVQNSAEHAKWGSDFGAATLSIQVGAESPKLVAGTSSSDRSGCRVCHSVSAYGDRMVVQHGEQYLTTSTYDLKNGNAETLYTSHIGWGGIYPDGKLGLSNTVDVASGPGEEDSTISLVDMATGMPTTFSGLNDIATSIALPSFSPDGKHAAFGFWAGAGTSDIHPSDGKELVVMDFDVGTRTFSNARKLWEAGGDQGRVAFNSFFPSSDTVVFQRRWDGNGDNLASRDGAHSELWWVDLKTGTAATLDRANGIGPDGKRYVPTGANDHADDEHLNYEPSISPVASGGYAWMVFMSRRLYGNVATSAPWNSDPRQFDTRVDYTTKKIWMVALDLNPTPGKDPSHPAFYIPGQELEGSNSRPFFSLTPCVTDRGTCMTGIDCCTGFCRDGLCVPPPAHSCSQTDEKCEMDSDCCAGSGSCIGGFCERIIR
ncbi:MAG TPA: hypothetical protein VHU80_00815 [Polyangiaceae bacterium]|nr:hypothetical protein [Polyangiaceae bacterium]